MARKIWTPDSINVLADNGFKRVIEGPVMQDDLPRVILERTAKSGSLNAAKSVVLFPEEGVTWQLHEDSLSDILSAIFVADAKSIYTQLIAEEGFGTYLPGLDISHQYQIALPGGAANTGEVAAAAAVRESVEELGIGKDDILACAPLTPRCSVSMQSAPEMYQIFVVLIPHAPPLVAHEGIDVELSRKLAIPLTRVEEKFSELVRDGYAVENLAVWGHDALFKEFFASVMAEM